MSNPYVGEIRMFGGSFAPVGWMFCNGQPLPISEYEELFNLIGTTYGGDGQTTFALPNLQSRVPVHQGQGPGITQNYTIGELLGVETVTLTTQQIPVHNHAFFASKDPGNSNTPVNNIPASPPQVSLYRPGVPSDPFPNTLVQPAGGSQPHDNMMPYLAISFIISLFGVFPTQS